MLVNLRKNRRRGATLVEYAFVLSATIMFVGGLAVFGFGIFRYQQVSLLASEGARYASVHGSSYAAATGNPKATSASIYTNAILPLATGLDTSRLSYTVTWDNSSEGAVYLFDAATNTYRNNNVTVTVSYSWLPEMPFLGGTQTLTGSATMPVSY